MGNHLIFEVGFLVEIQKKHLKLVKNIKILIQFIWLTYKFNYLNRIYKNMRRWDFK